MRKRIKVANIEVNLHYPSPPLPLTSSLSRLWWC